MLNKEKINQYHKQYRANKKEDIKQYMEKYYETNKDKINELKKLNRIKKKLNLSV